MKARHAYVSNEAYRLLAQIDKELNNSIEAEENYKKAVYMVPNRMANRFDLLNFYLHQKGTTNAVYRTKSIINMPVEVSSDITANLQKNSKFILESLK